MICGAGALLRNRAWYSHLMQYGLELIAFLTATLFLARFKTLGEIDLKTQPYSKLGNPD
jgi:hypothetical protein